MSLTKLVLVTGDTVTLRYQLISDGFPVDITGNSFKFAAKLNPSEATFIIDPVDGDIDDAAAGKFSFTLPAAGPSGNGSSNSLGGNVSSALVTPSLTLKTLARL